jgi:hypothetical protein
LVGGVEIHLGRQPRVQDGGKLPRHPVLGTKQLQTYEQFADLPLEPITLPG